MMTAFDSNSVETSWILGSRNDFILVHNYSLDTKMGRIVEDWTQSSTARGDMHLILFSISYDICHRLDTVKMNEVWDQILCPRTG